MSRVQQERLHGKLLRDSESRQWTFAIVTHSSQDGPSPFSLRWVQVRPISDKGSPEIPRVDTSR